MSSTDINCEEVIERLFEFLDQELDEDLSNRIEQHIRHCRDCFTRAQFERRLRERVEQASDTRAPESLRQRLQQMIDTF